MLVAEVFLQGGVGYHDCVVCAEHWGADLEGELVVVAGGLEGVA